jgi:two-component system NarL family sensor kinase
MYNRDIILATKRKTYEELNREITSLRFRLEETEQALLAIRTGEVDTLVVSGNNGEQVFTRQGADHSYRILLEGLNEAALILTSDGTILYSNGRFSEMTRALSKRLLGSSVQDLIKPSERKVFTSILRESARAPIRKEFTIRRTDRSFVPAIFSVKTLEFEDMIAFCAVVMDITEQKRTEEALQKSEGHYRKLFLEGQRMQSELRKLSREILRVQEEERTRISREIHDEIGQALTAISLNLKKLVRNGTPSDVKRKIDSVQAIVEKASEFIHVFSRDIHPHMLEDLGLLPALRSFFREFQKNTGMQVDLKFSGKTGRASIEQKAALYRIIQESLTNVLKHSGIRKATVIIRKLPKAITVEVIDKGRGFELADTSKPGVKRNGMGLLGMRERTRALGGTFMIHSKPGKGTKVHIRLPLAGGGGNYNGED